MKNKNIEFGFFILSIGILFLLVNIGIINWSVFEALFDLWPAIFIVIGINIIFSNNTIVRIITWLVFLGVIVSYGYFYSNSWNAPGPESKDTVTIEKLPETERGELKLALGGTRLNVGSTDSNLVEGQVSNRDIINKVSYEDDKTTAVVEFKRDRFINIGPGTSGDCRLNINENVAWDIDIDAGAVNGRIDMSNLNVGQMDVDMGAGNLEIIFGEKSKSTYAKIDAGASSFDITIPDSAGVKIKIDGALNNTNLKDLDWAKKGNYYVSPNYDSSSSKIEIDVDMGVGRFHVNTKQ